MRVARRFDAVDDGRRLPVVQTPRQWVLTSLRRQQGHTDKPVQGNVGDRQAVEQHAPLADVLGSDVGWPRRWRQSRRADRTP